MAVERIVQCDVVSIDATVDLEKSQFKEKPKIMRHANDSLQNNPPASDAG
jgi:hypothetical protein